MHLTDQELLKDNKNESEHLDTCGECQIRGKNLLQIRNQLKTLPLIKGHAPHWNEISNKYKQKEQVSELKEARLKLKFWKYAGLSLAASLFFVLVVIPINNLKLSKQQVEKHLAEVIEENNYLQQQLMEFNNSEELSLYHALLKLDIESLDQNIQSAYYQNVNDAEKSSLWQERKLLMAKLLKDSKRVNEHKRLNQIRI